MFKRVRKKDRSGGLTYCNIFVQYSVCVPHLQPRPLPLKHWDSHVVRDSQVARDSQVVRQGAGLVIERLRVRIPAEATKEFSFPEFAFCADSFDVRSPRVHLHVVGMLRFMSDINQPSLPTPFYSVLVSISVFMALSTVFHSINSPYNSSFSHSVLVVLVLPYWSFQLYISL